MQPWCLVLCGVVAACRPSLVKEYGPKCTEAIKARAANANTTYEQKLAAYDAFHDACHYACSGNDRSDFCAESYLLAAELDDPVSSSLVVTFCDQYKHAASCSWLAANPEGRELADEYNAARAKCREEDTGQEAKPASCYFGRGWSAHTSGTDDGSSETESESTTSSSTPSRPPTAEEVARIAQSTFEGQGDKLTARETIIVPASGVWHQAIPVIPDRKYLVVIVTVGDAYVDAEVVVPGMDERVPFPERKTVSGANYVMAKFRIDKSMVVYEADVSITGRSGKSDTGYLLLFHDR
jgi:hypothetical protein